MSINNSFDSLKIFFVKQAKVLLEEFNEFFPFAAALSINLEIIPINTYFGKEHPSSEEVIKHLEAALKASLKEKRFVSIAICSDVLIIHPITNEKMDALQIRYQNDTDERYNVYIPYYRKNGNVVEFLDEYREDGTLDLLS